MLSLTTLLVLAETPEKTVQAFVDAFNAHDATAMARQVVGSKESKFPFQPDFPRLQSSIGTPKIADDTATVAVDLTVTGPTTREQKTHETVNLRNVGGDWRIVPVDPGFRGTGDSSNQRFIGVLAMLVTNPQVMGIAKSAAKRTASLSNVKQIALATMLYASDHKDRLPDAKNFKAAIMPYLRNAEVLTAPGEPKGTVSYFLDPRLSGMPIAAIAQPAETAMILQGVGNKTAFPYDGKTPVGYVDGHAKFADATKVLSARTIKLK